MRACVCVCVDACMLVYRTLAYRKGLTNCMCGLKWEVKAMITYASLWGMWGFHHTFVGRSRQEGSRLNNCHIFRAHRTQLNPGKEAKIHASALDQIQSLLHLRETVDAQEVWNGSKVQFNMSLAHNTAAAAILLHITAAGHRLIFSYSYGFHTCARLRVTEFAS